MSANTDPLLLGLDLSTQSLTAIILSSVSFQVVGTYTVRFDRDLPQNEVYRCPFVEEEGGVVFSHVRMFFEVPFTLTRSS